MNDKKLSALQEVVKSDLKKAQYSVLRRVDDEYRQIIYKSHIYLQSGATSLNKAIDMATKDFLKKGIDSITYSDGKKVNIATYAEMCLRTASHRATLLGEGKKRDEWGMHLVVVSAHANTCPLCEPWQGKILIDDVFSHGTKEDGDYPLLSEAIKAGLLHPNCRHTLTTYFPGITQMPTIPDGEEAIKTYEAEQKQRAMERAIRKQKRIMAGTCDATNLRVEEGKFKELEKELKEHLKNHTELRRAFNREDNKVIVEKVNSNDIISNKKWLKAKFPTEKKFNTHVEKHSKEYGDITPEEYLDAARNLLSEQLSDDIEGFTSKDGFVFKYKKSTNDFALGRADGKISTLFKPTDKYDYWLDQIEQFKEV